MGQEGQEGLETSGVRGGPGGTVTLDLFPLETLTSNLIGCKEIQIVLEQ